MKTKYPSLFGLLVVFTLIAGLVVPASLVRPQAADADPGVCKWEYILGPLSGSPTSAIQSCSELHDMAVGNDGKTIVVTAYRTNHTRFYYSNKTGYQFSGSKWTALQRDLPAGAQVYSVAIAPDNPKFYAVTTDVEVPIGGGPREVWVTEDGGSNWELTNLNLPLGETIRCIDISVDYGGKRDIAVGTVTGAGTGDVYVRKSTGFTGWMKQNFNAAPLGPLGDFYAVKFSPTYAGDASLAVAFADSVTAVGGATWYNISQRGIDNNTHANWAFNPAKSVEVRDPTWGAGNSPGMGQLNKVDLELPSDFSGQAASLRRAYISLDSYGSGAAKAVSARDGIFRVDDTTVYTLMDTSNVAQKSIYSIAYFGTYASGKLLAGERMGFPCTATVPTWFTDSPTTCPIPCWYPALKPTTGAGNPITCTVGQDRVGAAVAAWIANGMLGLAITGSHAVTTGAGWFNSWLGARVCDDESAFAISRNNGETWNQLTLIDTTISRFTDVAPTPDCKTVYLASVNEGTGCDEFDSVWRSSSNAEVVSPLPALPIGEYWERVLTRVTAPDCTWAQTDKALLRIVPYCADPSGQIVAWGVYDTDSMFTNGIAAWSPDYGDYWANITPRNPIQDFTFESSTVMYFLSPDGSVQKMPYTGTAWATTLSSIDTVLYGAHTIAAYPEGKVLVGANSSYHGSLYAVSYSSNFNTDNPSFTVQSLAGKTPFYGDVHVAFHPNFKDNNTYFINDKGTDGGSVYRNNVAAQLRWADTDMMDAANGAVGCPAPIQEPQYGLVLAFTGEALYSAGFDASDNTTGVWRTIDDGTGKYGPLSGMPKPGIAWDCLDVFVSPPAASAGVRFTLEPSSSLKLCGCCTKDTDSTLYAIDNNIYSETSRTGLVWAFTDCMAKKGPKLITADKTLIGCDPVSGRAQEVNFCWEQLCVADAYDIEIAKSADFTIKIIDWVTEGCGTFLEPADVTQPCAYFPAGGRASGASELALWGNLECGHTYYWRVKVRECATGQWARSPWSEVRSFTVKAGLPVTTPYYGPQLLAPNNGCLGCPVKPASFSWSPFKDTTKYKFQLVKDAAMTQVVREAEVPTTAYEYYDTLDYSSNYFWRVQALEPAPSDWSAIFSFQTEAAPPAAEPAAPAPTPLWVWVVIAIGAILVIVTLVLIFKTRRV
jgi:hypothetical protein